jgi:hypothetical protein
MVKPHGIAVERLRQLADEYRKQPMPFSPSHPVDTKNEQEDDEDIVHLIIEAITGG